jgi:hypothetical protein
MRNRRLSKDYERKVQTSETFIELAMIRLILRRLAREVWTLPNRLLEEYSSAGPEPLAWPLQNLAAGDIYAASQAANNDNYSPLLAGQGLRMLKGDQGAGEIVKVILGEAATVLSRLQDATDQNG